MYHGGGGGELGGVEEGVTVVGVYCMRDEKKECVNFRYIYTQQQFWKTQNKR